jgi:hypothetical protein
MWSGSIIDDPCSFSLFKGQNIPISSSLAHANISLQSLLADAVHLSAFQEGGRGCRVALADFVARRLVEQRESAKLVQQDGFCVVVEPLDRGMHGSRRHKKKKSSISYPPYILERTDFWCTTTHLHFTVRVLVYAASETSSTANGILNEEKIAEGVRGSTAILDAVKTILAKIFDPQDENLMSAVMQHVAFAAVQDRLRTQLTSMKVVAFVANGAILPRKSGASEAPMSSPPAIPFKAPAESSMSKEIQFNMGKLCKYLPSHLLQGNSSLVKIEGLAVPAGITLICGGGYHGKSTLLQTIAAGIYDKVPGDGRELCVTVRDAVTVRAEDGRYVNNCNIKAFISNLPTPPGAIKTLDTQYFSSRDCSGSTSQAANVSEAIEMGASALLVDDDISAANFMARDGRMRALVMDESITPLLYRVNGLYDTHGISSVVVVGGVGDWLDVPHNVILLNQYIPSDATAKAQSVSKQFSYGHVQYAGRGVVHRLEWDRHGTPNPRRPVDAFSMRFGPNVSVSVMDNGHEILIHNDEGDDCDDAMIIEDDDDDGCIDASRFEQLVGKKQLYGCGLCVSWLLKAAPENPHLGLRDLLKKMDEFLDQGGMNQLLHGNNTSIECVGESRAWKHLVESIGFAHRPRSFEVGQALARMRGIEMEELPVEEDQELLAAEREVARRKRELSEIWAARRKKK